MIIVIRFSWQSDDDGLNGSNSSQKSAALMLRKKNTLRLHSGFHIQQSSLSESAQ